MNYRCTKCNELKDISSFYRDISKKDGIHSNCKQCHSTRLKKKRIEDTEWNSINKERSKRYRANNPITYKLAITNATLKSKYGISLAEYNTMLENQNYKCLVCGDSPIYQRLHVDHNHTTGKIRGLLCQPCNVSIGKMKESPELLRKLADYVEKAS